MVVRTGWVIGVGVEDRVRIERRVGVSEAEGAGGMVEEGSWKARGSRVQGILHMILSWARI